MKRSGIKVNKLSSNNNNKSRGKYNNTNTHTYTSKNNNNKSNTSNAFAGGREKVLKTSKGSRVEQRKLQAG